jgi:hypothetical protein
MRSALLAVGASLLLVHLWQFHDFTVDDAAISYSYAQNLIHGNGLVNVAGGERVEAYTNFLWVICVAAGMIFTHDGFLVGRILGALAALAILFGVAELLAALRGRRSPLDAFPAFFIALLMPISYWSMSGLECGLYMALGVWCATRLCVEKEGGRPWSALLAAALALTRPDGILLLGAAALMRILWDRRPRWYLLAFAPVAAHFAFRYLYYAFPLPNSYYVKSRSFELRQLWNLRSTGWGYVGSFFREHHLSFGSCLVALSLLGFRRWYPRLVAWSLLFATLAFPLYARGDWMAEGRFAVPLLPIGVVLACDGMEQLMTLLVRRPRAAALVTSAALVMLAGLLIPVEYRLTLGRRGRYPAPAHFVVDRANQYVTSAHELEVPQPFSVVEGDLGGTSWVNGFRVLDLGALGDVAITRANGNYTAFREHVLAEERPAFLRLQGFWGRFRFFELPEFAEEYLPFQRPSLGQGFWVARSAFLDRGWDTRRPVHLFGADGLDLIAADVGEREVRLWLLVRRAPAVPLKLQGGATLALADFSRFSWRAGEILRLRSDRPPGPLKLCGQKECIDLAEGHSGPEPPQLPPTDCRNWCGDLSQVLYERGVAAQAAGDRDRAYRDLWQSLQMDRSRAFARRHLEEVRVRPRPFSPLWRIRLLAAERALALVPDEEHFARVAQAALAADECEAAVRLQLATGLVPDGDEARLDLAECDRRTGRPSLGLPLLVEPAGEEQASRIVSIAFAAGAPEKARSSLRRLHRRATPVAPGLTLVAAWARPLRDGSVELSLALEKSGEAPKVIDVGGVSVPFDRPPSEWKSGEIFEHRVRLDLPPGRRVVTVGSASVEIVNQPFSEDFELGRADGWNGRPQLRQGPRWGIEGAWYAAGDLISPPLAGDEVCFLGAGHGEAGIDVGGRRVAQVLGKGDEAFRLHCMPLSPGARLVTRQMAIDDVHCIQGGRPLPCAGHLTLGP